MIKTEKIPLLIARANVASDIHKTGSWRFARPVQTLKTAPCSRTCPAGEDIAAIEMMLSAGRVRDAWERILQENPLPAVCGHVCFHPCESVCNRSNMDDAVAIHLLERFAGRQAIEEGFPCPDYNHASHNRRVAIIGSGPSGLSAAYFLSRLGFGCDVFEKETEPGGVLRWGIPIHRLPQEILAAEILRMGQMGVTIHCNEAVNHSRFEQIQKDYDAVYLGCGAGRAMTLNIPGEEHVRDGLLFLHGMREMPDFKVNGRTIVIGGGNTAIDVARTRVRSGAEVTLVYRRRERDMPAFSDEVQTALKEGVRLMTLASPVKVTKTEQGLAIALEKMAISGTDAQGRAAVIKTGGLIDTLHADSIVRAIGATQAEDWYVPVVGESKRVRMSHSVLSDAGIPVVSGGDLINQTRSVADAIASGKQAALAIDVYFTEGKGAIQDRLDRCRVGDGDALSMQAYVQADRFDRNPEVVVFQDINTDYFNLTRQTVPTACFTSEKDSHGFISAPGFIGSQAVAEAERCFGCGSCNECDNCRVFCPEMAVAGQTRPEIDLDYCKGCGICVEECPRHALSLVEEKT